MRILAVAMLLAAGCATAQETPVRGAGKCDPAKAQRLLGRPATPKLGAQALRLTGAASLRWIRPGDVVTMDYREGRVNLHLDGRDRVKKVACG